MLPPRAQVSEANQPAEHLLCGAELRDGPHPRAPGNHPKSRSIHGHGGDCHLGGDKEPGTGCLTPPSRLAPGGGGPGQDSTPRMAGEEVHPE